jgi:hypothetical protein
MTDDPAPRKSPVQHEWRAQEADKAYLDKALPYDCYWTAIDGGRAASRIVGAMRKKRGIKSGLPDWLIVWRGTTLWIERKTSTADSALSENQRLTAHMLKANGHRWDRANSTEEVETALRAAGIPLRATVGEIRERISEQNERLPPKRKATPRKPRSGTPTMSVAQYRRLHSKGLL